MVWNFLDCPALAIPVSRVDPAVDVKRPAHKFLNEPEAFKNAPIGFQVVARTHEDEAVIAMAEIIDAALQAF
ncbi:hypothetical protein C0989_004128 [Termitomyces sp. Mn162]|nr:hypothetical protein C0989_004128 [Termitomyces sp. Mn162]